MIKDNRKLRFGMVGGGEGAFIGQVHRMAAELDGMAELVCGAFASEPERARRSGENLYRLARDRCYATFEDMFREELRLDPSKRMDFVVIVTPNHLHYPVAMAALDAGFHVICDKPVTTSAAQAEQLLKQAKGHDLRFAVTHNYTGYPMIREAKDIVQAGQLGVIRRVSCEYLQGWLAQDLAGNKQADWRTDPARAGVAGCFGDIGSHADNLIEYVSGLSIEMLCADLSTFVSNRALDDDGNVLLRFNGGAKGVLSASQIAVGRENDLSLQIYGELGSLEWRQSDANSLVVRWLDRPLEVRRSGGPGTSQMALAATRIPAGHPEGYLEAFAEIYKNYCLDLRGQTHAGYPTIIDGLRGMRFIEAVVQSSNNGASWCPLSN